MLCFLFAGLALRSAIYRLPDVHEHITRPPHGVKFPEKVLKLLPVTYCSALTPRVPLSGFLLNFSGVLHIAEKNFSTDCDAWGYTT